MDKLRLEKIEQRILAHFHAHNTATVLTKEIFVSLDEFTNADLVRAFEDLEMRWRLIVRYTKEGDDLMSLTPQGEESAGLSVTGEHPQPNTLRHPPKSSTPFPDQLH